MYLAINIAIHQIYPAIYLSSYAGFDLAGALRMLKVDRSVEPVSQDGVRFRGFLPTKMEVFAIKNGASPWTKTWKKHMKHGALAWTWQSEMMK